MSLAGKEPQSPCHSAFSDSCLVPNGTVNGTICVSPSSILSLVVRPNSGLTTDEMLIVAAMGLALIVSPFTVMRMIPVSGRSITKRPSVLLKVKTL